MKHNSKLSVVLASLLASASAPAAVPLQWTVETSRAVPAQFEAYQGETLDLEAALQSYGNPLAAPVSYSLYWQTNGMGNAWWSTNCTTNYHLPSTNLLRATWTPSMETGARVYNCFIGQPGTIYHAAFQLRLRPSPGATPNELPLPKKVIDFSKVTVLNPPWSGGGGVDTNAVVDIIHKTVDLGPIDAQIAALQDGKRDLDDLDVYSNVFGPWVYSDGVDHGLHFEEGYWRDSDGELWFVTDGTVEHSPFDATELSMFGGGRPFATRTKTIGQPSGDHLAKESQLPTPAEKYEWNGKQSKITASGILKGNGSGGVSTATKSSTAQDPANADYRDPQDNTCHKTEFTEWVANDLADGITLIGRPEISTSYYYEGTWQWNSNVGPFLAYPWNVDPDATNLVFHFIDDGDHPNFTATRSAVCTEGKKFTTSDVVDGKVSAAVSTNNPAFVSAVLDVQVSSLSTNITAEVYIAATNACANLGIDPALIPGTGTTGTVGGLLVIAFTLVLWMRKKIFDNSGNVSDQFATDLLGKQVAKAKLQTIADEPTIGEGDAVTLLDGSAATVDAADLTSTTLNVTFGAARNDGLRLCELYVLNGTADTDLTFDAATVSFVATGDLFPACEAGINYFVFAEVAANIWKVTRETLKSITTPTPVAAA